MGNCRDFEPLGDLVVIERIEERTGLVQMIDPRLRDRASCRGIVRAVGPGKPLPDGGHVPMSIRTGNVVCFSAATGIESSLNGRDTLVMHESDVLAVVEP